MGTSKIQNSTGPKSGSVCLKRVVVSPDGMVRPVVQCFNGVSRQAVEVGDVIISCRMREGKMKLSVLDTKFNPRSDKDTKKWLGWLSMQPVISTWINDLGDSQRSLPAGVGWDGQHSLSAMKRMVKVREFFDGLHGLALDLIVNLVGESTRIGMPMQLDAAVKCTSWGVTTMTANEILVIFGNDGKVIDHNRLPTVGETFAYVQLNAYRHTNPDGSIRRFGVAWELYRLVNEDKGWDNLAA